MRWHICSVALGAVLLSSTSPAAPTLAQESPINIVYEEPTNATLRPLYERLKTQRVLEELQAFLMPLRLPRQLTVRTAQCGAPKLPYRSGEPVTVCYELIDQVEQIITAHTTDQNEQRSHIVGAFIEIVLHETASGIFDILQIPVWGREEDASDRLAALIMSQFGEDVMFTTIVGTAELFLWSNRQWSGADFASTASPEAQRFYNYLCVAYASDPFRYAYLVRNGILPARRADRCEGEYAQIRKAFDLRIMPYVDPDLLVRARATPWLTWSVER